MNLITSNNNVYNVIADKSSTASTNKLKFDDLPIDVKLVIFSFLSFSELSCIIPRVSKSWRRVSTLPTAWKNVFRKTYPDLAKHLMNTINTTNEWKPLYKHFVDHLPLDWNEPGYISNEVKHRIEEEFLFPIAWKHLLNMKRAITLYNCNGEIIKKISEGLLNSQYQDLVDATILKFPVTFLNSFYWERYVNLLFEKAARNYKQFKKRTVVIITDFHLIPSDKLHGLLSGIGEGLATHSNVGIFAIFLCNANIKPESLEKKILQHYSHMIKIEYRRQKSF